jgi:hypothetical protein
MTALLIFVFEARSYSGLHPTNQRHNLFCKRRNSDMRNLIRVAIFSALLLVGLSAFAQVSIGIQIGPPPPPRVVVVEPARPGPEYVWVDGYWYPVGHHYKWHEGYWTRPPYEGARWMPPHHDGDRYFAGYWEGERGRFDHDHHWDRDRDRRDGERYRDHDRDDHDRDHDRDRDRDRDR